MEIIRITPDKEKARSILKMTSLIEERIGGEDKKKMSALIIADYYEMLKELMTAALLIDGCKILSHKDMISYFNAEYPDFDSREHYVLDELRVLRNRISYEGFFVEPSYLERNEALFKDMVRKLRNLVEKKLG